MTVSAVVSGVTAVSLMVTVRSAAKTESGHSENAMRSDNITLKNRVKRGCFKWILPFLIEVSQS